jgi:hypothetical protein
MSRSAGTVASCICLLASSVTLVVGLAHVVQKVENLHVEFSDCSFFHEDCNKGWREVFTFRPNAFFDLWTPTVFGLIGIGLHCNFVHNKVVLNYLTYALFMLVTALFANIGYVGQFGVMTGALSFAGVIVCIIVRLMGETGLVILELGK